jgi:hypothetical protein
MMNKLTINTLIFLFAISAGRVDAQEMRKNNYVVSTVQVQQITPISLTAAALAEEGGDLFGNFELIIYGDTVTELLQLQRSGYFSIEL